MPPALVSLWELMVLSLRVVALGDVDVVEGQGLDVALGRLALALVLPLRDVAELVVVALGLAVRGLVLLAEVAAAGLLAGQGVLGEQLAELHEVRDAAGALERLVELVAGAGDGHRLPELLAQRVDLGQGLVEALRGAAHADVVPHDVAEL